LGYSLRNPSTRSGNTLASDDAARTLILVGTATPVDGGPDPLADALVVGRDELPEHAATRTARAASRPTGTARSSALDAERPERSRRPEMLMA
jgi:hypothetical protein